uniref:Uncharacterized protein n=1 Tax=Megaselia scalaris TaxID=36166 RepID=T1H274_MEGSC
MHLANTSRGTIWKRNSLISAKLAGLHPQWGDGLNRLIGIMKTDAKATRTNIRFVIYIDKRSIRYANIDSDQQLLKQHSSFECRIHKITLCELTSSYLTATVKY